MCVCVYIYEPKSIYSFSVYFWLYHVTCRTSSTKDWTRVPLQWKHGVLTTGPTGKSYTHTHTHTHTFFLIKMRTHTDTHTRIYIHFFNKNEDTHRHTSIYIFLNKNEARLFCNLLFSVVSMMNIFSCLDNSVVTSF